MTFIITIETTDAEEAALRTIYARSGSKDTFEDWYAAEVNCRESVVRASDIEVLRVEKINQLANLQSEDLDAALSAAKANITARTLAEISAATGLKTL